MDRTKLTPSSDQATWISTLSGLAHRVLGASVTFASLDGDGRRFEYVARGGELTVAATDGVSAAVGLHDYLRKVCGRSVGWDTLLPLALGPLPDCGLARGEARVREFYYLNFCTFSYTMPYWDWPEWEREIDWMALHGVTMPLALTGHEAVLLEAYTRLGLSSDAMRTFLGGPGYLPFQYMGCLDSFAGPLPSYWISSHLSLGRRILERERAFGMTPVLPAFTGHIPRELAPGRVREWQGFETVVLDAADPLYTSVGAEITRAQIELLGTDHLYAADPFIEMIPVDADPAYPGTVAAATLSGLLSADPSATWLMQAWPFSYQRDFWTDARVREFLDASDRMIVADLWAEHDPQWRRFDGFGGKPWLWCGLLNFGGRSDPAADLRAVPLGVEAALASANPPVGLGLSMEAIHNNPVFFELIADLAWNAVDLEEWLDSWVACRYGRSAQQPVLQSAWRDLLATVYACDIPIFPEHFHGVLTTRPSYHSPAEVQAALWYDPTVLARAWSGLITAGENDPTLVDGPLAHDLVTVAIAYLTRLADHYCLTDRDAFLALFPDLDALLATHPDFRLSTWEAKATRWAQTPEDHALLLTNARQILTTWGPTSHLDDYAARHYSGLVAPYYLARWSTPDADQDKITTTFLQTHFAPSPPGDLLAHSRHLHTTYAQSLPPPHEQTPGQT